MIPNNIDRSHILAAIEEISNSGTPPIRQSNKYALFFEGRSYSPKYVISLANERANGTKLNSSSFNGGREANEFLSRLGFMIAKKNTQSLSEKPIPFAEPKPKSLTHHSTHNERCPECKKTILKMLQSIYGGVDQSYSPGIGTMPEDFSETKFYKPLLSIYQSLQNYRGYKDFVRTRKLRRGDYFIPSTDTMIEFDETQHFTACRKLTLSLYGEHIQPGFNVTRWINLCEKINKTDPDPKCIFRDEQRAWYDTLRDVAPDIIGISSIVRLFSKDHIWCKFNPNDSGDISRFKLILAEI